MGQTENPKLAMLLVGMIPGEFSELLNRMRESFVNRRRKKGGSCAIAISSKVVIPVP
jgi:hypothetical protein